MKGSGGAKNSKQSEKKKFVEKCFSLNPRCCPDGVGVEFILERHVESVQTATAKFFVLMAKKGRVKYYVRGKANVRYLL